MFIIIIRQMLKLLHDIEEANGWNNKVNAGQNEDNNKSMEKFKHLSK